MLGVLGGWFLFIEPPRRQVRHSRLYGVTLSVWLQSVKQMASKKVCWFKKWRNRPGCDVHFRSRCLNALGASCAVKGGQPPWLGGERGCLSHGGKILLQKRIFKQNHEKSCRNIENPRKS